MYPIINLTLNNKLEFSVSSKILLNQKLVLAKSNFLSEYRSKLCMWWIAVIATDFKNALFKTGKRGTTNYFFGPNFFFEKFEFTSFYPTKTILREF